ncbi:MAG: TIGR03943 family protein [Anaerolineae bacterium]
MRTRQWLQAAVMLLLGLYLLETLLTGEVAYYINERFNWLALLAGFILIVFGVVQTVYLVSTAETLPSERTKSTNAPRNLMLSAKTTHVGTSSWLVIGMVSIPVVLGIFIPARPLGAAAINGGIATSLNVSAASDQQFSIAPEQRNVLDWVRAFSAAASPEEFNGQPADLIGFVYRDVRFDEGNQFMVTRFTVQCCVADALPIGVVVSAKDASQLAQDSWVRVRGTFEVRQFDGHEMPILIAQSIEPTEMPERPYLFP